MSHRVKPLLEHVPCHIFTFCNSLRCRPFPRAPVFVCAQNLVARDILIIRERVSNVQPVPRHSLSAGDVVAIKDGSITRRDEFVVAADGDTLLPAKACCSSLSIPASLDP